MTEWGVGDGVGSLREGSAAPASTGVHACFEGHALAACWPPQSPQAWRKLAPLPERAGPLGVKLCTYIPWPPALIWCWSLRTRRRRPSSSSPSWLLPSRSGDTLAWCETGCHTPYTDYCRFGPTGEEPCIKVCVEPGPGFVARRQSALMR